MTVAAVTFVVGGIATSAAADGVARTSRVRSDIPSIAAAIQEASELSATFGRLIETVDGTDGLVYVESGRCGHGVRACLTLSVKVAGPHRILRILVDPRQANCDLMASLGHELQHAAEVLSDPAITTNPALFFFFHHRGSLEQGRFETPAAIQAGLKVGAEMERHGECRYQSVTNLKRRPLAGTASDVAFQAGR